jgi:hypothetical protein
MCGCGKKSTTAAVSADLAVESWGPSYWYIFHIIGENIGVRNTPELDADLATRITVFIQKLDEVLPCAVCRAHALTYKNEHPFSAAGLTRTALRDAVRGYFFEFHNAVRLKKGQPLNVDISQLPGLYFINILERAKRNKVAGTSLKNTSSQIVWFNNFERILQSLQLR